jgi:short-subunit dehydrogenase
VGLAECLRSELTGSDIHVTVVYPVSTPTEFREVMVRESGATSEARGPTQRVEDVADAIARAIEHPVPEVYPYWKSRGLVWLNAFAPGTCDRFVKKFGRRPVS